MRLKKQKLKSSRQKNKLRKTKGYSIKNLITSKMTIKKIQIYQEKSLQILGRMSKIKIAVNMNIFLVIINIKNKFSNKFKSRYLFHLSNHEHSKLRSVRQVRPQNLKIKFLICSTIYFNNLRSGKRWIKTYYITIKNKIDIICKK